MLAQRRNRALTSASPSQTATEEPANAWRGAVTRGARWLWLSPLFALVLAPVAVFARTSLLILALFHCYWAWLFTAGGAPSAAPHLERWRWVLRALALAGVGLVLLSYEGYRALLIATVAAYLAYLSALLPALGLVPRKGLRAGALAAASCCALVVVDLALRRWLNWVGWGTVPGNWLSALAVPLGLLAWLEVDRVRVHALDSEPAWQWSPIRALALKLSGIVIPGVLGAGIALISAFGGFWFAWNYTDLEPGVIRASASFVLLCVNGAVVLLLRKRSRQTLRRAVVGAGLTHIPLWWFLVFPTQFDANEWKRWPEGSEMRSDMAEDLVYSRTLLGKTRSEVVELLGPPGFSPLTQDTVYYPLHGRPCRGFVVYFDEGGVVRTRFWMCD